MWLTSVMARAWHQPDVVHPALLDRRRRRRQPRLRRPDAIGRSTSRRNCSIRVAAASLLALDRNQRGLVPW
jgi:hypothetical protein